MSPDNDKCLMLPVKSGLHYFKFRQGASIFI